MNESLLECGETSERGLVVCPAGAVDFPEGELVAVAMQLTEEVLLADGSTSFIYSVVFDSDGDAANDWVFQDPYDWDYFQGTDRWYQLIWDHGSARWTVAVTQVDAMQTQVTDTSSVRVVVDGDTIICYIPRSELPGDAPGYRVTAFAHDGSYTESSRGGDVSGANPTEPLTPIEERG